MKHVNMPVGSVLDMEKEESKIDKMGKDILRRTQKHKDVMQYTKTTVTREFSQAMLDNNMKGMLKIVLKAKVMRLVL